MTVDAYTLLRLVHILSAAILFGTGLGIAFFMWTAHRSRDVAAIAVTMRNVVVADFMFTAVAIVVQPLTGWVLVRIAGHDPLAPAAATRVGRKSRLLTKASETLPGSTTPRQRITRGTATAAS